MRFLKIKIFLILLIIPLIFLLNFYRNEVKNFFYLISKPIQKSLWRAGDVISDFFEAIMKIKKLKEEVDSLRIKNQELMAEIISLQEFKKENEILREALKIGLEKEFKLVFAEIIGKDPTKDSILIDKGSNDGLSQGLPVITKQKVLIGKVDEVYKNFSKIQLITAKENSFDVEIREREVIALVKGKGNFNFYLDLVPREKEIKEGDLVITSALGGIFPKGLLVAEIKKIKKSDIEPFQQAEISPLFDLKELEMVFVILEW